MIARRLLTLFVLTSAGLLTASAAAAADTFSGEVVDLACFLPHPETGRGAGHRKCAETCVKKGLPMGLVTSDGQVYVLLENHDNPKPYADLKAKAAQTVTVEGTKATLGGTQGIVVETVK